MGDFLGKLFVNVEALPQDGFGFLQVCFLGAVYLYILLIGANMIGDGSELLMLIPSLAGIVGSVVLPVLGAVPDGAIVLFSGMGPAETAASQVSVGVGALAGSTVMLLTIPWFLSVIGGRVPIINGEPNYARRGAASAQQSVSSGVAANESIRKNAIVMLATCLPCYLIVEIPALVFSGKEPQAAVEHMRPFVWMGVAVCTVLFVFYIALQYRLASVPGTEGGVVEQRVADTMLKAIETGHMGLRAVLADAIAQLPPQLPAQQGTPAPGEAPLLTPDSAEQREWLAKLRLVVHPIFHRFDNNGDGTLDRFEMANLVDELGERPTAAEFEALFQATDVDQSGTIDYNEFAFWITQLLQKQPAPETSTRPQNSLAWSGRSIEDGGNRASEEQAGNAGENQEEEAEEDDEEEAEVPEDIREQHLPPEVQRRRVLRRAFYQMGIGTAIVLLFSDPMVDVLDAVGNRTGVPNFYVAFLLGPVASNASEMVASYKYAKKKTRKSISVSFSQLLGAACMNNTFCLLIFYLLIAFRGFSWVYHAEVGAIIFAEVAMCLLASRRVQTVTSGLVVLSVLPISLVLVVVLKATVFKGMES